jgi:hypothetical protein
MSASFLAIWCQFWCQLGLGFGGTWRDSIGRVCNANYWKQALSRYSADELVFCNDIKSAMLYQLSYRPDQESRTDSYCNASSTVEASFARPAPTSDPR